MLFVSGIPRLQLYDDFLAVKQIFNGKVRESVKL